MTSLILGSDTGKIDKLNAKIPKDLKGRERTLR